MASYIVECLSASMIGFRELWGEKTDKEKRDVRECLETVLYWINSIELNKTPWFSYLPAEIWSVIINFAVIDEKGSYDFKTIWSLRCVSIWFYNVMSDDTKFPQPFIRLPDYNSYVKNVKEGKRLKAPSTLYITNRTPPIRTFEPIESLDVTKAVINIDISSCRHNYCGFTSIESLVTEITHKTFSHTTLRVLDLSEVENPNRDMKIRILQPQSIVPPLPNLEGIILPIHSSVMQLSFRDDYKSEMEKMYSCYPKLRDIWVQNYRGKSFSPLAFACLWNEYDLIKYLLTEDQYRDTWRSKINRQREYNGITPLNEAIRGYLNVELVKLLVENGADVNLPSTSSCRLSPIQTAVSESDIVGGMGAINYMKCISIINYLLQKGADINAVSEYGETCLLYSCIQLNNDNLGIMDFLLRNGAKINQPLEILNGVPGLLFRVISMKPFVIKKLVENGANTNDQITLNISMLPYFSMIPKRNFAEREVLKQCIHKTVTPLYLLLIYLYTVIPQVSIDALRDRAPLLATQETISTVIELQKLNGEEGRYILDMDEFGSVYFPIKKHA